MFLQAIKNNTSLIVLAIIHIIFATVFFEANLAWTLVPVLVVVAVGYKSISFKAHFKLKSIPKNAGAFFMGIILTLALRYFFALPVVLSAALAGLVGAALFTRNSQMQALAYAGAFAGMSKLDFFEQWPLVLTITLTGAVIFNLLEKSALGLGGKLGAIGFGASAIGFICFNQEFTAQLSTSSIISHNIMVYPAIACLGAYLTCKLSDLTGTTNIITSALSTALFSVAVIYFFSVDVYLQNELLAIFFAGTFVGMTSKNVLSVQQVIIAALLLGLLLVILLPYFGLIGGTLGTLANLCCIAVFAITQKLQPTPKT